MDKRVVWLTLVAALLVAGIITFSVQKQQGNDKEMVIGVLAANDIRLAKLEGLKDGLRKYGFKEGENVEFIIRNAGNEREKLVPQAKELVYRRPTAIVAMGGVEADVLKDVTRESKIPVIFAGVALPVERGLVSSYMFPGNNLTGVDNFQAELVGKKLEFLKMLVPSISRVLILYDPRVPSGTPSLAYLLTAAEKVGFEVSVISVMTRQEIDNVLECVQENRKKQEANLLDAVLLLPSFVWEISPFIHSLSLEHEVPVVGLYEAEADRGFFVSYGSSYYTQGFQAARLVAKVLQGQDPAQMPVETAYQLELVVNLRVASKLGLQVNPEALRLADVIIRHEEPAHGESR
ncbi:hypothetical protein SY88_07885 [Clostridiales bacterium PH28_bin88]|nr:hypothetical protein SY88_07885 [Clostridiales bacterium PH28_bin88]